MANLIGQYESGQKENINTNEYSQWVLIRNMLTTAEVEESIFDDFAANPSHYKTENGEIVFNENWEEEARNAELTRIANLHITKLDFFTLLCVPAEITYEALEAKINELGMQAQWNLCNHVYYGIIQPFLKELPLGKTEQEIIEIFEQKQIA